MKTVATFTSVDEANLVRGRLESAGIPAFVQDEHMVQLDWMYSNAIGGVRVQTMDDQLELAREYLAADSPVTPDGEPGMKCPSCGSTNTVHQDLPRRLSLLTVMILSFPLPFGRSAWKCAGCGHVFRVPRDPSAYPAKQPV